MTTARAASDIDADMELMAATIATDTGVRATECSGALRFPLHYDAYVLIDFLSGDEWRLGAYAAEDEAPLRMYCGDFDSIVLLAIDFASGRIRP